MARLLIIDDDESVRLLLKDLLADCGHQVLAVSDSGEEAIRLSGEMKPDAVLMDILLGSDVDGIAAADHIQSRMGIPIIFLTGYFDPATLQRAMAVRPYGYLLKPFESEPLQKAIEIALYRSRVESKGNGLERVIPAILDQIAYGVIAADKGGLINFVNPSAVSITRWNFEEALQRPFGEIFNVIQENSELQDSSFSGLFASRGILTDKMGMKVPIEFSSTVVRDQPHTGFVVIFHCTNETVQLERALAESRKKYKNLINSIDGIVWEADPMTLRYTFVSKQAERLLGYPPELWIQDSDFWTKHLFQEDRAEAVLLRQDAVSEKKDYESEYRMITADGRVIWLRDIVTVGVDPDGAVKLRGVMLDVTRAKEAERALRESEERYALAAKGSKDGLWDWNLETNQVYYSSRWKEIIGFDSEDVESGLEEWLDRVHPDDLELLHAAISSHLLGFTSLFENQYRMRHKDGSYRWVLTRGVAIRDAKGVAYRMAGSQTDITDRRLAEERLLYEAAHDSLTGLPNRAWFLERLKQSLDRARRVGHYSLAVLFLDIDRFKNVNDGLGHAIGDELLTAIARRLEGCVRPGDGIARLSGDEFAILLEDLENEESATTAAERIQKELAAPFHLKDREIFTSVSIGIAHSKRSYQRPEDLLRDADTAMYRAKARGKARHEVFNTAMHLNVVELLQLENDLRASLEKEGFLIHYQPIINLNTSAVTGFEALLRWHTSKRGLVIASDIVPIAEETGLIIPIGLWVLRKACEQMTYWQKEFGSSLDLTLSVNLSTKLFSQPDLTIQVRKIVEETGVDPRRLKLEITESVLLDKVEQVISKLLQLRSMNLGLQIDDFGTGYSSLSYLHSLPIDTLKIDRSFVQRLGIDNESPEIVKTILTLARKLQLEVIAEGVESTEQLERLRELGCEKAQGYLFYKPLDAETATKVIAESARLRTIQ